MSIETGIILIAIACIINSVSIIVIAVSVKNRRK